ncbi:hypothetical protein AAC387_Pa03g2561 [Persea americana]
MVVGTADRNLVVFNLQNPQVIAIIYLMMKCTYITGFIYFTGANLALTLFASVLCVVFAPTASGPGIPESVQNFLLSTGWMDIHIELGQCRNCVEQISPSAGYSPTAPGYSPSSTGQYTPQLSNRDKDEDKNG